MKPYQSVLDKINKIRFRFDLDPLADLPKGDIREPGHCPIANALFEIDENISANPDSLDLPNLTVNQMRAIAEDLGVSYFEERLWVMTPKDFRKFIREFDDHFYPQLVL
jgi:hypothetical protein